MLKNGFFALGFLFWPGGHNIIIGVYQAVKAADDVRKLLEKRFNFVQGADFRRFRRLALDFFNIFGYYCLYCSELVVIRLGVDYRVNLIRQPAQRNEQGICRIPISSQESVQLLKVCLILCIKTCGQHFFKILRQVLGTIWAFSTCLFMVI